MKRLFALLLASLLLLSAGCDGVVVLSKQADLHAASSVPASASSEAKTAQLYLPNDNMDGFVPTSEKFNGDVAVLVELLAERDAIPQDSAVNAFQPDGLGGAALDMNAAYGAALSSTGTTGEYIMLGSLVNTLLKTYALDSIRLTIDGTDLNTGHDIYDYDLHFYADQTASVEPPAGENAVWQRLTGYWNAAENIFVRFGTEEAAPTFEFGLWETDFARGGVASALRQTAPDRYETDVFFAATPATEMAEARAAETLLVQLEISGLEQDGKIQICIEGLEDGAWKQYAYGGATAEEALAWLHG